MLDEVKMVIQNIGARALSLYIEGEELSSMGLSAGAVGYDEASVILRRALAESALPRWEPGEMEIYPGKDAVLLFIRRKSDNPHHYYFGDFELLIEASRQCMGALPSKLAIFRDGYLLTVYPFAGDAPPAVLTEYGESVEMDRLLFLHLREQGSEIISTDAIGALQKHFIR